MLGSIGHGVFETLSRIRTQALLKSMVFCMV